MQPTGEHEGSPVRNVQNKPNQHSIKSILNGAGTGHYKRDRDGECRADADRSLTNRKTDENNNNKSEIQKDQRRRGKIKIKKDRKKE